MPQIEVCYSPYLFPLFARKGPIVVVIDILRATSAICAALHAGVEKIIPVETVEQARTYQDQGYIAAAERNGQVLEGFALGNSPFSFMHPELKGTTIVLSTTNGTQAIAAASPTNQVVIGSYLNLSVLAEWLIKSNQDVILLCAGWKNKFNLEDSIYAGALANTLIQKGAFTTNCDSTMAAMQLEDHARKDLYFHLQQSSHFNRLSHLNLEKDIRFCLTPDQAPVVPLLQDGALLSIN